MAPPGDESQDIRPDRCGSDLADYRSCFRLCSRDRRVRLRGTTARFTTDNQIEGRGSATLDGRTNPGGKCSNFSGRSGRREHRDHTRDRRPASCRAWRRWWAAAIVLTRGVGAGCSHCFACHFPSSSRMNSQAYSERPFSGTQRLQSPRPARSSSSPMNSRSNLTVAFRASVVMDLTP